jgi:hypothetical protein
MSASPAGCKSFPYRDRSIHTLVLQRNLVSRPHCRRRWTARARRSILASTACIALPDCCLLNCRRDRAHRWQTRKGWQRSPAHTADRPRGGTVQLDLAGRCRPSNSYTDQRTIVDTSLAGSTRHPGTRSWRPKWELRSLSTFVHITTSVLTRGWLGRRGSGS